MSTMLTSEITTYFQIITLHTANELTLYERIAATLKSLRFEDEASRKSAATSLLGLQRQIVQLAGVLNTVRSPVRLSSAHETRVSTAKHMAAAAGELANALTGPSSFKSLRLENARKEAEAADGSMRSGANSITATLGAAGASVAAIPVVGQIIAAILTAIAAIIMLIARLVGQSHEDKSAKKEDSTHPKRKDDD